MRAKSLGTTLVAIGLAVAAAAGQQQPPVFRSGVDLYTIDVVVLDKSGAPVADLTANDFVVVADKKPRRIVAARYVSSARPVRAAANLTAPAASSNSRVTAPRTMILVVDVNQIPSGGGRLAMTGISQYLDRLLPSDKVGVMTLSDSRVPPTTNRAPVREALTTMIGTSNRFRDKDMTFGEGLGIAARDRSALLAYWSRVKDQGFALPGDRTCAPPQDFELVTAVPQTCVQQAEIILERARHDTNRVLSRLKVIAEAMRDIDEPKAIVLVSGGVLSDGSTRNEVTDLSAVTEGSRVSIHTILIEAEASVGAGSTSDTRRLDSVAGFGGLADISEAARGSAQRVLGPSINAMTKVDRELSGYYLLSFERDAVDQTSGRQVLDVRANRPGLTLTARKGFTPPRPNSFAATTPAGTPKDGIVALLKNPVPATQVPMDVDVFALPISAAGNDARAVIAIEAGRDPSGITAFGYQVAEAGGKVAADGFEAPPAFQQAGAGRSLFIAQVPLRVGRFIARFAVIDASGQRGSVQHTFEITPWQDGAIRSSDIILGTGAGAEFSPAAAVPASGLFSMRLVVRDSTSKFDDITVKATVKRASDDSQIETSEVALQSTPDTMRRFADHVLRVGAYAPGEYVITMVVTNRGAEIGRRHRVFVR